MSATSRYDHDMSPTAERILKEALELPENLRLDLAAALLESLDHDPPHDDDDDAGSSEP